MSQFEKADKRCPVGALKLKGVEEVFLYDGEIIITGQPDDEDELSHSCDCMGCNSLSHVIFRGRVYTNVMEGL